MLADERANLIARVRAGDEQKLGSLLDSYRDYLSLLAEVEIGRRLQRKVDASDIVQETFLEAHRQFPRFQGTAEPQLTEWIRTILAGILANTIRRYFGTQARNLHLEQELSKDLHHSSCQLAAIAVDPRGSPSAEAVRDEQTQIVFEGIGRLPQEYRDVIIMRHLEGLSFNEIATRMNRTVDSVEKLWVRGLAKLKQVCVGGVSDGNQ